MVSWFRKGNELLCIIIYLDGESGIVWYAFQLLIYRSEIRIKFILWHGLPSKDGIALRVRYHFMIWLHFTVIGIIHPYNTDISNFVWNYKKHDRCLLFYDEMEISASTYNKLLVSSMFLLNGWIVEMRWMICMRYICWSISCGFYLLMIPEYEIASRWLGMMYKLA